MLSLQPMANSPKISYFSIMKTPGLSSFQIGVMSVTAGICVANIYYNQPILNEIAATFHASASRVGIMSVLAQAGYGLGLFFITPLGDKANRKTLISILQAALIAVLLGIAFSASIGILCVMSLLVGLLAVAAQVILPMAATLDRENRGKTVGVIFTGILVGILGARVFSGYIAEWFGWRYVYGISAGLVFISAIFVRISLPGTKPVFEGNYVKLLESTVFQFKRFALLRRTAFLGALVFGVFCSFWTTLTFHLGGEPFHYRADIIGLFGLLAIAGALLAPVFGKRADRGGAARSQLLSVLMIFVGIILILLFPNSLAAFIIAVVLLDVGVQATQVTNIAVIYTLDENANSRINTVYMTSYFLGGAMGTFTGIQCWKYGGWTMVTIQLLLWTIVALGVVLYNLKVGKRP
jgi:predicted MFS family arabinose efflux permease